MPHLASNAQYQPPTFDKIWANDHDTNYLTNQLTNQPKEKKTWPGPDQKPTNQANQTKSNQTKPDQPTNQPIKLTKPNQPTNQTT